LLSIALFVASVGPGIVGAQTTPGVDSLLLLVPIRPLEAIRADVNRARQVGLAALDARGAAEELNLRSDAHIEAQKQAIDQLNARLKVAKDAKREAETVGLEVEKKAAERAKELLERRKALREAEIDLARAGQDLATAAERAYGLEAELAGQRAAAGVADGGTAGSVSGRRVLREIEKRTLEAMKSMAEREISHAERGKRLAERRLEVMEAQVKLVEVR
jgi:hypothetical protein